MSSVTDRTVEMYGSWTVLQKLGGRPAKWLCVCKCGRTAEVRATHARAGLSTKCKHCARKTHGHYMNGIPTAEYMAWASMIQRCTNAKDRAWRRYGGRGIEVCERWLHSFERFLSDVGPRPSSLHSLDRFPDPDGNYEPGNCRWATRKEQQQNKSGNRVVTCNGVTQTVPQWAEQTGLSANVITKRLRRGWSPEQAMGTPSQRARVST